MDVANKCIQWVKSILRKPFPFLDPSSPPPELAASEEGTPKPSPPQAQLLDLSIPLISFCLASATSIALLFRQIHGETPPSMHFFCLALFPYAANMLELAAIFCVATGFYLGITLFLPLSLKIASGKISVQVTNLTTDVPKEKNLGRNGRSTDWQETGRGHQWVFGENEKGNILADLQKLLVKMKIKGFILLWKKWTKLSILCGTSRVVEVSQQQFLDDNGRKGHFAQKKV
ncbi:hypothetical protein Fot_24760 [Forsythia ovata]|uniref:Uncharacterized protein n=1 Tax=Forsythia ovata TaxID=205694 RepID=A0ABD1U744_9LAMI